MSTYAFLALKKFQCQNGVSDYYQISYLEKDFSK